MKVFVKVELLCSPPQLGLGNMAVKHQGDTERALAQFSLMYYPPYIQQRSSGLQPLHKAHTKKLVQFFPKVTITTY